MPPISGARVPQGLCTLRFLVRGRRWLRSTRTRLSLTYLGAPFGDLHIMKTSYLASLVALSTLMVTMPGCAGETDEPSEPNQPAESTEVRASVDTDHVTPSYTPRVTITDIKDGNGS